MARYSSAPIRRRVTIALTIGLAIGIGTLTLYPLDKPDMIPGSDKLHHVLAFAALVFPGAVLFPPIVRWVAPLAIAYGAAIEVIQPHVGRAGEVGDFWADVAGVLIGLVLGLAANGCSRAIRQRSAQRVQKTVSSSR